jgi:hypothetical protein
VRNNSIPSPPWPAWSLSQWSPYWFLLLLLNSSTFYQSSVQSIKQMFTAIDTCTYHMAFIIYDNISPSSFPWLSNIGIICILSWGHVCMVCSNGGTGGPATSQSRLLMICYLAAPTNNEGQHINIIHVSLPEPYPNRCHEFCMENPRWPDLCGIVVTA